MTKFAGAVWTLDEDLNLRICHSIWRGENGNDWEVVMPFEWAKRFTLWLLGMADKEEDRMTARGENREDFFPVMTWTRLQPVVGWRVDYALRLEDGQGSPALARADYELVTPREVFEFVSELAKRLGLEAKPQMHDLEIMDVNSVEVIFCQQPNGIEIIPLTHDADKVFVRSQDARLVRNWLDGAIAAIELGQGT